MKTYSYSTTGIEACIKTLTIKEYNFMVYPLNAIDKLGFSEIKDKIKQKCLSESGRELVEKFSHKLALIR
nr:hypothetical protein [Sphingobacterium sp. E70]